MSHHHRAMRHDHHIPNRSTHTMRQLYFTEEKEMEKRYHLLIASTEIYTMNEKTQAPHYSCELLTAHEHFQEEENTDGLPRHNNWTPLSEAFKLNPSGNG